MPSTSGQLKTRIKAIIVFKTDSSPTASSSDENGALLAAAAGAVSPVNELNAINRAALCKSASLVHVQRNDQLKPEGANRWLMYLVEGSLTLYLGKEEVGTISARTKDALQPLFLDKTVYNMARTSSVAKVVKFGREQINILLSEQQKNAIHVIDIDVSDLDNLIFDDVIKDMAEQKISLASFGEVSAGVLKAHAGIAGIPELADLIQSDPGLSAFIVHQANRADASGDSIHSIRGAISRLGVETTQRAIEELLVKNTMIPANRAIEGRFRRFVQRTSLSAAIVQVLAKSLPDLKGEQAALVALTADIGELMVITYANNHPDMFADEHDLAMSIEKLRPILGGWLLSQWDFPDEYVDASHVTRDWYRNNAGELNYTDLVTAALLIIQSEVPDSEPSSIPNSDNLLLARRMQQAGIDLSQPAEILRAATGKIMNVQQLLKAG
ncbi:MAG: HDOD domain-containing protein [Gammaproteobacteria bacterium]|nr:HDOD domain-containing protein [Gammaproteobacteria bacterium]